MYSMELLFVLQGCYNNVLVTDAVLYMIFYERDYNMANEYKLSFTGNEVDSREEHYYILLD